MRNRVFKSALSLILCAALLIGAVPMSFSAESNKRTSTRLADFNEISEAFLSDSEARAAEYPNGAMMIVETSAELEMNGFYAIDIFRQGGTAGTAKIKLSTVDMSAGYGEDYRLYLSDDKSDEGVDGEKKLYYYESGVPYIARLSDREEYYLTPGEGEETAQRRDEASEINDTSANTLPHSTETVLTFADGENSKTVYIETLQKDEVTDDLEFMLLLSEPENCSASASMSGLYTIKEKREKPKAKLELTSTSVNPESDEAYVSVKRTGNLGGYDSFRITTQSDSAEAERDYVAVAEDLRFIPNVSEIKVPITMLEGAGDGRSFSVELSDASDNVEVVSDTASVAIDNKAEITETGAENRKYVTDFTYKVASQRSYEFVDLSKFHSETCLGDWGDATAKYENNYYRLDYSQGSWKNHAVDAMSPSKVSLIGVKSVRFCFDNKGGSCSWDDSAVVFSETNPLDDGDRECCWMEHLGSNGTSWGMSNISSSHLDKTITPSDGDKSHDNFIYLAMNKGGFSGNCGVKFHDYNDNADCSFRFNLQDYQVKIIDPEPIMLYDHGELKKERAVSRALFTDPNKNTVVWTNDATFYRYDTTTITATVDSKYGVATLKGIYICKFDNEASHSSLIPLTAGNLSLTPQFLKSYSNYIINNKFKIQPVYEFEKADFTVESYENTKTGVSFKADNSKRTGDFYVDGEHYGKISWSGQNNRGYYDGDSIRFTYTPDQSGRTKTVEYDWRCAKVKSDLDFAQHNTVGSGKETVDIEIKEKYFRVTPLLIDIAAPNQLLVKNPDRGDYTSKGSKYEKKDNGTATVTGYYFKGNGSVQTIDESFENYKPGARLEFTAKPNSGYYAQWTYTDASTHQTKTYRGNTFYYTVQNPFFVSDNIVTLEFIAEGATGLYTKTSIYSFPLCGSITVPDGTILHPATSTTTVTQPAENAIIYMDGYSGVADANGKFTLVADPDSDAPARIPVLGTQPPGTIGDYNFNETHRALVYYNGNYHICDVQLTGSVFGLMMSSFKTDIVINTGISAGVVPKRVEAFSSESGVYGDSITIVNARSVNFNIDFDARNLDGQKPVNFTRWSFISEEGMIRSSTDIPIDAGTTRASFAPVVSEKAKPGDHLYIEFYNRSYDSSSNPQYTFYGKFEVGYTFIAANIEKVMSYMPDLGYYDNTDVASTGSDLASTGAHYSKVPSAPGIGPISPLFSIYGFLPVYSDGATGQKDAKTGKDLYCLEIGVQFSVARSQAGGDDASWGTMSVAKQWEKLAGIIAKSPGELVQNMQTSTKITLSVTFAYRVEYYTGNSGERYYVSSLFMLGFNISAKVSIPFTIVAIPCFVYIEVAANNVGYYVNMPNDKTEGYWTSEMLDNDYYSETHGEFTQDFKIEFGVGIGFDGLAAIGGHISFHLLSQLSGSSHGKMTAGIKGGVFAQLLFFKVDKTWDIDSWVLLDTDADLASVGANLLNEESGDLFAETKLSDLKLAEAADIYDDTVNKDKDLAATGSDAFAIKSKETYAEDNTAQMKPVMAKISDTRYMLASARNEGNVKFGLSYYIYDTEQREIVERGNPVDKVIEENQLDTQNGEVKELIRTEDLVGDVNVIDCGEKLLLVWEGCMVENFSSASVDEALQAFGIAAVVFDKKTGEFTDFDLVNTGVDVLPDQVKGVYNPKTGLTHIFYESVDVSDITGDTTLDQLHSKPLSLNTCSIDLNEEHPKFSEPEIIENKGVTISDYDVSVFDDDIIVTYICARKNTLTVEKPLTGDKELFAGNTNYGTINLMYLNRYSEDEGTLEEESSILIADSSHVTANPEFVKLSYQGDENTLLFYKCNGRYGYQNIENLYIHCAHEGWDQSGEMDANAMTPSYITVDEDHTVGEDFKVYPGADGELFALWTLAEGSQQQIWGRQFVVDSVTKNDVAAAIDNNGNVMLDDNNNPVTEKLSEPVSILNGYWGNKVRLTSYGEGSYEENQTGYYKGAFDAAVLDADKMVCAYYSYDYDFGGKPEGDEMKMINGRFIISEFDINPDFHLGNSFMDAVTVDNEHPTPGETIKITTRAANTGFTIARDVTLELMFAGQAEPIATVNYPVWLAGEDKECEFEYTIPADWDFEKHSILPYYAIYDDGQRMYRSEVTTELTYAPKLSINLAHADPENYITKDHKTAAYHVTATIQNIGNAPYEGGDELDFIFNDIAAQADVMNKNVPDTDPFYINYGGIRIPAIEAGSEVKLSFVSEEIPESIFDKYGTNSANLKLAITPEDGIGWEEVKGEEPYYFLDELGIGQFVKPVPDEVTSVAAEAITVPLGSARFIQPVVAPLSAAADAEFTFSTKDKIITVDETGLIRGNDRGTATVTVTCGDVSTDVLVTVGAPEVGDVDGDGDITILDATAIQRHLAEVELLDAEAIARGDADRDGELTILDATTIQRYLAMLIYAL